MTRSFTLPACRWTSKPLPLLSVVVVVALVLVLLEVSNSTIIAFSSLSKFSLRAAYRRFSSRRIVKQGDEGDGAGVSLFTLALPPVTQFFLQSWL
jgi:hypothetical protein